MAGDAAYPREDAILSDGVCEEKGSETSPREDKNSRTQAHRQPHENGGDGLEVVEKDPTLRAQGDREIKSALPGSSIVAGKEESPSAARKAVPGEFDLLKVIGMGAFGKVLQVRVFGLY